MRTQIKKGVTTWKELIEAGLAKPCKRGCREPGEENKTEVMLKKLADHRTAKAGGDMTARPIESVSLVARRPDESVPPAKDPDTIDVDLQVKPAELRVSVETGPYPFEGGIDPKSTDEGTDTFPQKTAEELEISRRVALHRALHRATHVVQGQDDEFGDPWCGPKGQPQKEVSDDGETIPYPTPEEFAVPYPTPEEVVRIKEDDDSPKDSVESGEFDAFKTLRGDQQLLLTDQRERNLPPPPPSAFTVTCNGPEREPVMLVATPDVKVIGGIEGTPIRFDLPAPGSLDDEIAEPEKMALANPKKLWDEVHGGQDGELVKPKKVKIINPLKPWEPSARPAVQGG